MKDGIIKGTGDSRYLKGAGWPATYAEFKAMAEAGTLPFDLNGINSAGWQQIGTALNKANLLTNTTAAKLNGVATPNAAFDLLSRFHAGLGNEYIWQRSDGVYVNSTVSNAYPPTPSDGYTYTPLGQIGNKVQIATGSYVGTGTFGDAATPNTYICQFVPKVFMIIPTDFNNIRSAGNYGDAAAYYPYPVILLNGTNFITDAPYNSPFTANFSGSTVTWYSSGGFSGNDARDQLNVSGETYLVLYFG